jgi:RsiW-degrading membrane proteinase PrsW (M82 family)
MIIILTASLTPVFLLLLYIYLKDRYQREPFGQLMKAFLGGILAGLVDVLILSVLGLNNLHPFPGAHGQAFYQAFFLAGIPEELFKLLFLYLFIWKSQYFDEYYDGIEYAAFVGLGFAGLENIMYVWQGGLGVAVSRAMFAVPAHFFFAIIMGYFFAFAKFRPRKKKIYLFLAFLCPAILHGIYDFILMYANLIQNTDTVIAALLNFGFFIFFSFLWKLAIRRVNHMIGK